MDTVLEYIFEKPYRVWFIGVLTFTIIMFLLIKISEVL